MATLFVAGMCGDSLAQLIDRGNQLIYDQDLDITYYDHAEGPTDWATASAWASNLEYGGFSDWRLPKMKNDPPNFSQTCSFKSYFDTTTTADRGWNKASSEFGHLFYEELDGVGWYPVNDCVNVNASFGLINGTGPFTTLQSDFHYWFSNPEFGSSHHWNFTPFYGGQGTAINSAPGYAVAVRDGDVESGGSVGTLEADSLALVALYNSTSGQNWTNNANWLTGAVSTWNGVTVTGGRVTDVVLEYNNLAGPIPSEMGNLTNLQKLNFFTNQLTGAIPSQLGSLTNLDELILSHNQLTGDIPSALGSLSNLAYFSLWDNQLTGEIPATFVNLTSVYALDLMGNQLVGEIPDWLENLSINLKRLYLSRNQLTGGIPVEIGNLPNLEVLWLYDNLLTGEIPVEMGNLVKLNDLLLYDNQLTGGIPVEIGNLTNLTAFKLHDNPSLSGILPSSLTNLTSLSAFWFQTTGLCSPLDETFQTWLQGISDVNGSNCFDTTSPSVPTGLSARSGDESITLTWSANTESDLAGYRVYRGTAPSTTTLLTTIAAGTTTYSDSGLTNGITYYYRLTAVDTSGNESDYSGEVSERPLAPALVLTHFEPFSGIPGTEVTLYGVNFDTSVAGNSVTFGGVEAVVIFALPSRLRVRVPTGVVGPVIVSVTVNGGVGTAANRFMVLEASGGQATFGPEKFISTQADLVQSVFVADLDGDGDLDVLSASTNDDKIAWYSNDGAGGFSAERVISTQADGAISVFAEDLDGDGDLDVLSASWIDNKIAWYSNDGAGGFSAQQIISTEAGFAQSVFAADLDGDGDLDVLSAADRDDKIAWYENDGAGSFSTERVLTLQAGGAHDVFAADLDGDGDLDVLSASQETANSKIAWYENDGAGGFSAQQIISKQAEGAVSVFAADLDGDGDLDILSASQVDDKIAWYTNDGAGIFSAQQIISTQADLAQSVIAADLDGDGDLDVLSASIDDDKIAWYANDGAGGFSAQQIISTLANGARSVFAADFDGDGDLDVLSASFEDDKIAWYENGASPVTDFPPAAPTGLSATVGDAEVTLTWNPSPESDLAEYRVYRGTAPAPTTFLTTISAGTIVYTDTGLTNGTTYNYRLKAVDQTSNESPFSDVVSATPAAPMLSLESDSLALVALYNATDGANWTNNTNWLTGPVTDWFGVTVSNSRITELDLENNKLSGSIPDEIGDLTSLVELDLSWNQLTGGIPVEIGNLTDLTYLHMGGYQLSGPIPNEIGNLTRLQLLNLGTNQLSGEIPAGIGSLSNLSSLHLGSNQLSGEIPAGIWSLTDLILLNLESNSLSGSIPTEIGNLTRLKEVYLSGNQLSGGIPSELGQLTNLIELFLSFNQLTGEIPSELGNLLNLSSLVLNDNSSLSGALPLSLSSLSSLSVLLFNNTGVCSPLDEGFQSWIQGISDSNGSVCPDTTAPALPDGLNTVAGDGSVTLSWFANTEPDLASYRIYRNIISSQAILIDSVSAGTMTFTDTGLENGTTYYYWLKAVDTSGNESEFSTTVSGTPNATDTKPPAVPTGLSLNSTDATIVLNWSANADADLASYRIYRGTSSSPTTLLTSEATGTTTYRDIGLTNGTRYYYRMKAVDQTGNASAYSQEGDAVPVQAQFTVIRSQSFGNATLTSNYRMVSLPGDGSTTVGSTFSGTAGTDWNVHWDNGNSDNFLIDYSNSSTFRFTPGRGFWAISKNGWDVSSRSVSQVNLSSDGTYSILLHDGWNIIGNPFEFNVSWSYTVGLNSTTGTLNNYSGSFSSAGSMEPYKGYYYFNRDGLSSLKIPYLRTTSSSKTSKTGKRDTLLVSRLIASDLVTGRAAIVEYASAQGALEGIDDYDRFAPPGHFDDVSMVIVGAESRFGYRYLSRDVRPQGEEDLIFDVLVKTTKPRTLEFEATRSSDQDGSVLYLIDAHGTIYSIGQQPVSIPIQAPKQSFTAVHGSLDLAESISFERLPGTPALKELFPNPSSTGVTVEYVLPEDGHVVLKVFDVLGREIATLIDGEGRKGMHRISWSGHDANDQKVSSGLYFIKLTAGSTTSARSLIRYR